MNQSRLALLRIASDSERKFRDQTGMEPTKKWAGRIRSIRSNIDLLSIVLH